MDFAEAMGAVRCYAAWNCMRVKARRKRLPLEPKWKSFEGFFEDMGAVPEGMVFVRIDRKVGFLRSNCKWGTRQDLANRDLVGHLLTRGGETHSISEWSRIFKINPRRIKNWIDDGYSFEDFDPANKRWNYKLHTYKGETLTLEQWAERTGIPRIRLVRRLAADWTIEKALTTPIDVSKSPRHSFNSYCPKSR